jgi:hypothetical protein
MNGSHILTEATEMELATAVSHNLFALFRAMAEALPGGELVERHALCYHHTFPTNPMFKGVWQTRLADDVETTIDETIAWFKERNAPFFFWWTEPETTPTDLGQRLQAHGLLDMAEQQKELAAGIKQTEQGAPCMVADLQQMNEAVLTAVPPTFTIEEVQDELALYEFKRVFVDSYEIPDWAGRAGWTRRCALASAVLPGASLSAIWMGSR